MLRSPRVRRISRLDSRQYQFYFKRTNSKLETSRRKLRFVCLLIPTTLDTKYPSKARMRMTSVIILARETMVSKSIANEERKELVVHVNGKGSPGNPPSLSSLHSTEARLISNTVIRSCGNDVHYADVALEEFLHALPFATRVRRL